MSKQQAAITVPSVRAFPWSSAGASAQIIDAWKRNLFQARFIKIIAFKPSAGIFRQYRKGVR
jgi:hypothetical protein